MSTGRRPVARSEQQSFRAGGQQTAVDTLDEVPTYAFLDAPTLAFAHRGGDEVAPTDVVHATSDDRGRFVDFDGAEFGDWIDPLPLAP